MENKQPKRLLDILKAGTDYLAERGVDSPRLQCELLASRLLSCKRLELYLKFETVLGDKLVDAMRRGVKRVGAGEPVQYVIGQTEFMGHVFRVDKRALIPRPDTEVLVEQVLKDEALWAGDRSVVVDVGTGSGCIVLSLALARKGLFLAIDRSAEALELARENAAALGVADRVGFTLADDLSDWVEPESADAIVANLPYIRTAEWAKLPVHIKDHEPRLALDGGEDGLSVIRQLVEDGAIVLKPGGRLYLEIGYDQGSAVCELMKAGGYRDVGLFKDFGGRDRVVCGRIGTTN